MNIKSFIKPLLLLMALCLMLTLCACGSGQGDDITDGGETADNGNQSSENKTNKNDSADSDEIVELPDGLKILKSKIQTLEDGTRVTVSAYDNNSPIAHRSYLPDGTIAVSDYYNTEGEPCEYKNAASIFVKYFGEKELLLKTCYYRKSDMKILQEEVFEYTASSTTSNDTVTPSASTLSIYNELSGEYEKSKKEYNLLFGKTHPDMEMIFDKDGKVESHTLYEYSDKGVLQKKECFTKNTKTELVTYDSEGLPEKQYIYNADGTVSFEKSYTKGVLSSEKYINADGSHYTVHFENGITVLKEATLSDGSTETTDYDENGLEKLTVRRKPNGAILSKSVYEHYRYTGKNTVTTYDGNDLLLKSVEYYGNGETFEGYISYNYHRNGVVSELIEYNADNEVVRHCFYNTSGKQIG